MSANGYLQLVFYIAVLLAAAKPLGTYMARIYAGEPAPLDRIGAPFERLIYRLCGIAPAEKMRWIQYAMAALWFSLLGCLARHAGMVLTHRHLLREVWGPSYVEQSHYLRIYMKQLRHKLEPDPARPRFLLTETGVGYRLASETEPAAK